MGFFSALRNTTAPARNPVEDQARALLAIPLLVAAADGNVSPDELTQIGNLCAFNPIFRQLGAERTHAILTEHAKTLRTQGGEALLSAVLPALGPKLRETAMCFAIRAALADGRLEQGEIQMLEALGSRLGITMPVFEKIFTVMMMLQRGRE